MNLVSDPEASGFSTTALEHAVALLEEGIPDLHDGYQIYVSRHGVPVLDHAGGEAQAGVKTTPDTIMLWFSSSKPLTSVAIGRLWEQGALALDDPVRRFIPEFANGKEAATVRHVLTHMGGFPFADFAQNMPWDDVVRRIVDSPALFEPGTVAAYHATAGWVVLGEIVRRLDGRRIDRYLADEVFGPLGMDDSHAGIPPELVDGLRDRVAHIAPKLPPDDPMFMIFNLVHLNTDEGLSWVSPGGSGRGPAHDLGRFYEMVLGRGERDAVRVLSAQTLEAMTSPHRIGVPDVILSAAERDSRWGAEIPWCLGFVPQNVDYGKLASYRSVGHSGHASSTGFCDPEHGLVVVVICNGLPGFQESARRISAVTTAVYEAAGVEAAPATGGWPAGTVLGAQPDA